MKKRILYIFAAACLMGATTSCNDFGDVNIDPEHLNQGNMDYSLVFTQVQSQIAGSDWDIWRNSVIYAANMIQHTSSARSRYGVFYTWSEGYNAAYWDGYYTGGRAAIRNVVDVMENWKEKPKYANEYQYARVMKAYMFQRMTDLYGDVPYFEAARPSVTGYPKYDTQQAIYDDLLKEMDEVNTALEANISNAGSFKADVIFNGDSEKWRKFANSLMLRAAMRLSKVDAEKAKTWATKALANGLFDSAADNAILKHSDAVVTNDSAEPFGKIHSNEDAGKYYISEFFIDELKATKDPRIHLIATKTTNPRAKWAEGFDFGNSTNSDELIGFPIGYEQGTTTWGIQKEQKVRPFFPDYIDPDKISDPKEKENAIKANAEKWKDWESICAFPNRLTYSRPDVPSVLITYTENNLLLADAAARGFIPGGEAKAKEYFEKGVKAAMEQFTLYPAAKTLYDIYLTSTNVDKYLTDALNRFDANPLKEINWQYYITTFGDEYEAFANWRRTGYPEIKSVYAAPHNRPAYTNSISTEIPRRFTYPSNESQYNATNYDQAVSRLSDGDKMTSRVWWDKQ